MAARQKSNKGRLKIQRKSASNGLRLTRREVARRELVAAIKMFFRDGDPVVIHLLVCASHDISQPVAHKAGKKTLRAIMDEKVRREYLDSWREMLKEPYNFFKHGGASPDEELAYFDPKVNEVLIFEACNDHAIAFEEVPSEAAIFEAWYVARNPDVMTAKGAKHIEPLVAPFRGLNSTQQLAFVRQLLDTSSRLPTDRIVRPKGTA